MQNALLVGLSRQVALAREIDVIANNIANINTTGYKADGTLFEEYLDSAARSAQQPGRISFVRDRGTWHDLSAGPIEQTGNPLNVAIDGNAFLVVQTARGQRFTRNGAFQINGQGQLVTGEGDLVLGDAGPITFQPTDNSITIGQDGTITAREGSAKVDSLRGSLRLVAFTDASQLQKDGNSTFAAVNNAQPQPTKASRLIQGSLEKSNVRSVLEMSRMVEVTRTYTQIAAMLQNQSDQSQQTIDKLAEVPA